MMRINSRLIVTLTTCLCKSALFVTELDSAPRAREHLAVPNAPGGAIAGVLDCGDCAACG